VSFATGTGGGAARFATGAVAPELRAEFPGLRLHWTALDARVRRSSPELRRRLRQLSDRYLGAGVVAMRTKPIPHAYRAFFRQVGVDPDAARIPSEEAAVRRLVQGRFQSRDSLQDALLVALVETGVPVWALDARAVDAGSLGIRVAAVGDRLGSGSDAPALPAGQLVVADADRVHATLFGANVPEHTPGPRTRRVVLFAVGVDGVPAIHVEEALWAATEVIEAEGG
jgi:DNA/RNA-binding domain of Phe-tRNA-synthetase-like protein